MSDALTSFERRVLDLWDANVSIGQIAEQLQVKADPVRRVVSRYNAATSEDRAHAQMMVQGSAALSRAIHAARRAA